jgi:hypothetical protein
VVVLKEAEMRRIVGKAGILMSVLVLIGLTASSCGGGASKVGVDADEVVANLLAAQAGITTYKLDLSTWSYQYSTGEGLIQELTLSMDASAAVDRTQQQMEMDMTVSVAATGHDTETTHTRVFLLGDCLYTGTASSSQEWSWTRQAMPSGYWDEQEAVDQQLRLLEGSRRKIRRDENVDGVDCHVLELTPDLDQLWSIMTQSWMVEMSNVTNPKDVIKDCSVTQWVAKDTSLLSKGVLQMNLHLGSDNMVTTLEFQFHDYNEPVSINLPPEAEA